MGSPAEKRTVVYVVAPSTDADGTVTVLQEDGGITVETVRSTAAGRERLDVGGIDCIVSEHRLPDGDGLSFLETVREAYGPVPFVLYPSDGNETLAARAFRNGVTDYVSQSTPGADVALRDRVDNALGAADEYRERTNEVPQPGSSGHTPTELGALTTRCRLALNGTDTGIWEWNLDTDELIWDERAGRLAGYSPREFTGTYEEFTDCVHPADIDVIETAREQAIETGSYEAEFRILANGTERWIRARAEVFYRDDGTPDRMIGVGSDITDRKEAERAVEETKEYYSRLFQQSSDFVLVIDTDGTVIDVTPGVEYVLGYEPEEMIGMDAFRYVHPDDRDRLANATAETIQNPEADVDAEYRSQASDGSYRWLEAKGSNYLDDPLLDGLVANVRDISERKRREQELEALTTRLELALEETDTGVWEWDLDTDEIVWDEACERLFGLEPGAFPGTYEAVAGRLSEDDRVAFERAVTDTIDNDRQLRFEFSIDLPDGDTRWIQTRGIVEYDADGDAERMLGIKTDITDRKEAERAVEETKEYYQRLFQQTSDYVTVVDETGTITDITSGVTHTLGYETGAVIGTDAFGHIHPDDRERTRNVLADVVENPEQEINIEYRARTEHGDYRWMEARGSNYLDDPLLDGIVVYVRDITQQKKRQQDLATKTTRLQRKNEQLERLAQIVSHDLQTPLSTAEKLTGLLRSDLDDPDPAVERSLADLEATHQRLRAFADHLPRLARESTDIQESTACDLRSVADAAWNVVDTGPLDLRIDSTRTLDGDPERLQRVFENLFQNTVVHGVNAVDGNQEIEATAVRVGAVDDGFYIADDGPGIRPEQRAELFEYGMGTGSGSGFGLAIVRTIIEAHGWTIAVTDSQSGGARFEVDTT